MGLVDLVSNSTRLIQPYTRRAMVNPSCSLFHSNLFSGMVNPSSKEVKGIDSRWKSNEKKGYIRNKSVNSDEEKFIEIENRHNILDLSLLHFSWYHFIKTKQTTNIKRRRCGWF